MAETHEGGDWELPPALGAYRPVARLGKGATGEVFKAVHPTSGAVVAIKVLPLPADAAERKLLEKRFLREARIGTHLRHPGIVRVHDADATDRHLFLIMDYVDGDSVRSLLEKGALEARRSVEIARAVAEILAAAHEAGVVHRDIKPANILVDPEGRVRLADFGVAHLLDAERRLTRSDAMLGTPQYMAPEQFLAPADELDARADVYSLGVVLYEMLTGVSPFSDVDACRTLQNVESLDPPPPSALRRGLPPGVDGLVMKGMAKRKEERHGSATEMAAALGRLLVAIPPAPASPPVRDDAPDEELIDRGAFERLGARYRDRVFHFLVTMIADESEAEDLTQETFRRAWANLAGFERRSKFSSWLFQIAVNLARNHFRNKAVRNRVEKSLEAEPGPRRRNVLSSVVRHETASLLARAIDRLPHSMREAFALRFVEQLDYPEIAAITGVSVQALHARVHRARLLLREQLGDAVDTFWKEGLAP